MFFQSHSVNSFNYTEVIILSTLLGFIFCFILKRTEILKMYIKVKTMDGKESVMLTVSKMSLIEEVRRLVKDKLNVEPSCQRLFFRGKQVN